MRVSTNIKSYGIANKGRSTPSPCGNTFLCVREGKLMRGEDVSHHGSLLYNYTEVSNNPKWAELYQAFERLEEYMNYADSPQWERHLEPEQEEAQNGPSMTM